MGKKMVVSLPYFLDLASVTVFALTGGLAASRAQLDIVGFIFIAALTGVGGGTMRDVLLDREIFWITDPNFIITAALAAILVFFTAHQLESRYRALLWLDACALAVAVSAGVAVAWANDMTGLVVMIMGMVTGFIGGLMRDVVCNELPLVLKQGELYVSCAFVGASFALITRLAGGDVYLALLICGVLTFMLRAGSLLFGWRLPIYRSRPIRDYPPRDK